MSNETDLDWLARDVHVWPTGEHQPWCYVYWKGGRRAVSGNCITVIQPCVRIEKSDWLSRRAELQNKPSWALAPEWADWLAQDAAGLDGIGAWWWFRTKPTKGDRTWSCKGYSSRPAPTRGEVLGDWRDTLERRPEAMTTTVSQEDIGHLGMKSDHGKPILGAIPPHAELAVGLVLAFGAEKYARGNWDHVADHENRYMDAALRHLNAHRRGELVDGESGESHLAHAACCILFLLDKQERAGGAA